MTTIQRFDSNGRFNRVVIHNGIVYVAGITASDRRNDIHIQTADILNKIDAILKQAGSAKSKILTAQVWLKDIERDFAGMNAAWEEWADKENLPTRATCEAKLASDELLIEIIVTAAL